MSPSTNEPWRYCSRCGRTGPVPECFLCEKLNGRPMTGEEQEALLEAYLTSPDGDWWLDVPFADGTTPRQRNPQPGD